MVFSKSSEVGYEVLGSMCSSDYWIGFKES